MAFSWDGADSYMLGFAGGTTQFAGLTNTTAEWVKGAWHTIPLGPSTLTARSNASMVYDAADGYVLMFGGYTGTGGYASDTWTYVGGTWTKLSPASSPQASAGMLVYIPLVGSGATSTGGYALLFGGHGKAGSGTSNYYGYTWKWSAGAWTNISANVGTAPGARAYGALAWDTTDGYALLMGGISAAGTSLNDTWKFVPTHNSGAFGGNWTQINGAANNRAPTPRYFASASWVTALSELVLVSGANGPLTAPVALGGGSDTWTWIGGSTNTWSNISATVGFPCTGASQCPKAGYDHSFADLPTYSYAYLGMGYAGANVNATFSIGPTFTVTGAEDVGELVLSGTVHFYANVTGGVGPFSYAWSGLPTGCTTANLAVLTCVPTAAGVFSGPSVTVSGSDSFNGTGTMPAVTVDPQPTVGGNLTIGPRVGTASPNFWSLRIGGSSLLNHSLAALYNQTPSVVIRYGGGDDATNVSNQSVNFNGCFYNDAGVCGNPITNFSAFKVFCNWVRCKSILAVPAETNDPGAAAVTVRWIEQTLGFTPTYWSIGNEPGNWIHFNEKFSKWKTTDSSVPTGLQFALDAQNITRAIRSVDATTPIIGSQSNNGGSAKTEPKILYNVSKIDGANISAIASHDYPGAGGTQGGITQSAFLSYSNVVLPALRYRQNTANETSGCAAAVQACRTPILYFVNEFNGASVGTYTPYQQGYPEVPFTAAVAAQLLALNVSMFTYFELWKGGTPASEDLLNSTTGNVTPAYQLYAGILKFLPMGQTFNATVATTMKGIFAVQERTSTSTAILIANTNTSVGLALSTSLLPVPVFATVTAYTDAPGAGPSRMIYPYNSAPGAFTVPAEGVLLVVETNATFVTPPVQPGGLFPTGSAWSWIPFVAGSAFLVVLILAIRGVGKSSRSRSPA